MNRDDKTHLNWLSIFATAIIAVAIIVVAITVVAIIAGSMFFVIPGVLFLSNDESVVSNENQFEASDRSDSWDNYIGKEVSEDLSDIDTKQSDEESLPVSTVQEEVPSIKESPQVEKEQELIHKIISVPDPEIEIKTGTEKEKMQERIQLLETREFFLKADGTARDPLQDVKMKLTLKPIEETQLSKFDIIDGLLIIGIRGIGMEGGLVEIKGNEINIMIEHDNIYDPYIDMTGTIDEPILQDQNNEQNVSFVRQMLYSMKDDTTPLKINLEGTLAS